ncbi:hypothetical protein ACFWJQ_12485 [Streptomyces goshikiensis]|uniref:hypothetical protein n=1 Tax=Streptomyces goshikiensis TaxID=1942 RepID=UPI003666BB5C
MSLMNGDLRILEYIYDQSGGDLDSSVDLWVHFDQRALTPAVRRLQSAGLISLHSILGDYTVTRFGISRVSELRTQRRNMPARMAALRKSVVLWLYGKCIDDETPVSTEEFLESDGASFLEHPFSLREVEHSVTYLNSVGLIRGMRVDQSNHLFSPSLTAKGIECAESEKSVSDFLNPPASGGPTFNVRVDGSQNVNVGTQSDFIQNNTSGIDAAVLAQLGHFASIARQGIPSYGLEESRQVEVQQIAQELESEAGGDAPDRGRLHRLTDRLMSAIAPAAGTALGGMVTALGEQALQAIAG